jgi:hypothetical protein
MRALGLGLIMTIFTACVGVYGPDVPRPIYYTPAPVIIYPYPYYYAPYYGPCWGFGYGYGHGYYGHGWRR